jgi:hypothetical protein
MNSFNHKPLKTSTIKIISFIFTALLVNKVSGQFNQKDDLKYITECDSFVVDDDFIVKQIDKDEIKKVFAREAFVYCSPDEKSKIMGSLAFNSRLNIRELISRYRNDTIFSTNSKTHIKSIQEIYRAEPEEWYKILYGQNTAYIKKEDLAIEDYSCYNFLVGIKSAKDFRTVELRSFDENKKYSIKDTFTFQELMQGYEIQFIPFNGLKNSGQIIRYRTFRTSCPGAEHNEFVIYSQNGFTKLLSAISIGEDETFDKETIYLPLKFDNGKILLVANGDLKNIFNVQTTELNVLPYPKKLKVPIEQLIIKTKEYTETILNSKEEPIVENKDKEKVRVIKEKPKYYKWDGTLLIELK